MDTKEFQYWIKNNNIHERTINSFWQYIKNYQMEEPEEFMELFEKIDVKLINVRLTTISVTLNYRFDELVEYVVAFLIIEYNGNEIGEYESLFTLEGEDLDDYLRIKSQ